MPALTVAILLAATAPQGDRLRFTDVSKDAGITARQVPSETLMGAGGAFLDYDGDGRLDVLVAGGIGPLALYRNLGGGKFSDVTVAAGLQLHAGGDPPVMGVACADYDDDGHSDLLLLKRGPNVLLRNRGDGTFTNMTRPAGVHDREWSSGAAFADYDGDGDLDLYVGNYIRTINFPNHTGAANVLYENLGNGAFADVTASCGVGGQGTTLAVSWFDYDDDGDQDLWVGNDFGSYVVSNRLYRNDGPDGNGGWRFVDVAPALGADQRIFCMGSTAADIDRDLDLDVYMSNLGTNVLLRNDRDRGFADITQAAGVAVTYDPTQPPLLASSWGVGLHDFDSDGWLDLYVSNGHIPADPAIANGERTPNSLYRHSGNGTKFTDVSVTAGVDDDGIGRGCAFGDFDGDGDVDVLQANLDATAILFRNDSVRGAYLTIDAVGRISNRDAIGTRLIARAGGTAFRRDVQANYSFESSSTKTAHFGLGNPTEVGRLELRWPDGTESRLHHLPVNRSFELVEPVAVFDRARSSAPAVVRGGTILRIDAVFANRTSTLLPVRHLRIIRIGAGDFVFGPVETASVPGDGSATATWSLPIPAGLLPPGQGVPIELLWFAVDAGGGVDAWRVDFVIQS